MTSVPSLDAAMDVLYGGPLDGFVAARDALVAEVRAAGDRDLAKEIKALRKPTVAADALNRALRQNPEALEQLLASVDRLRETQEAMLEGGAGPSQPVDFAADQRAYRSAVEAVAANATSNEIEVRAALEAAAVGGLADRLRAAAFAVLPEPTGGFGPFAVGPGSIAGGGRAAASGARSGRAEPAVASGDQETGADGGPRSRGPSAAERRLAERVRQAAERAVAAAEQELSAADAAAVTAAARVAEIDEELADLERRIGAARSARDEAVAARAAADAARAAADGLLDEARAALDGLQDQ